MRGWVVAAVVGLAVTGACSGGGGEGRTGPTIPTDTSRATTTTSTATTLAPASYDVPEVIDQAYVQRVVSAYDKVLGDAIRVLKRDGGVSDEFLKHLLAIYTEPEFESQTRGWQEAVAEGDLEHRPSVPGDPETTVVRLARADSTCVTAEIDRDFRPTLNDGIEPAESPQPDYVVLVRKKPDRDPVGMNSTPWVMAFDGFKIDGSEPVNSCDD